MLVQAVLAGGAGQGRGAGMNNAAFLRLLVAERGRHQQAIAAIDALLAVYDSHPSEEALQATEREQLQPLLQDTPDPSAGAPAAASRRSSTC